MHGVERQVIPSVGEDLMTDRLPSSFPLDVSGARLRLGEHRGHDIVGTAEPVLADEVAPSSAKFDRVSVGCRLDEGPAQLGNVFDSASWSDLFPIDQPYREAALDHDVSGLQVVVDHALGTFDQFRSEVVKLPHDACEQRQIDLVTRRHRLSRDPGEHLPFLFIDAQGARRPRDVCSLEVAQDPLSEAGVPALRAPHRVANASGPVHENSVAHPAQRLARKPSTATRGESHPMKDPFIG